MKSILFVCYIFLLVFSTHKSSAFSNDYLGKHSIYQQIEIIAYPNPFREGISLEIIALNVKPTELRVFDIIGTEMERIELSQFGAINIFRIELKNLTPGIYFCNVYADKKLLESKKITCTH